MPLVYWSARGEAFPPAGATEETGQRKQMKKVHGRTWGCTNELRVGIGCHASIYEVSERRFSHEYVGAHMIYSISVGSIDCISLRVVFYTCLRITFYSRYFISMILLSWQCLLNFLRSLK